MAQGSINVNVGGIQYEEPSATYKRVVLKSNLSFASQVTESNRLYVIKWDFDLGGQTVNIPNNCILQFEGGVLRNGTVRLYATNIWPNYNALTAGNISVLGYPAIGTIGYVDGTIKYYDGSSWKVVGEQELFYEEYAKQHNDGDFVYDGSVVKSNYDYYEVSANKMMTAVNNGYKVIKYGFTRCKIYFVKKDSAPILFKDNLNLPYTITSEDTSAISGKTGTNPYYLHVINTGNLIPRDLRIVY